MTAMSVNKSDSEMLQHDLQSLPTTTTIIVKKKKKKKKKKRRR